MAAIIEKRDLRDFDWLTTLIAVAIVCFGVWQIYNAQPTETYWSKQIIGLGIALVAFLVVGFSDYRRIIDAAPIGLNSFRKCGTYILPLTPIEEIARSSEIGVATTVSCPIEA